MKKCVSCKKDVAEENVLPIVKKSVKSYYDADDLTKKNICETCLMRSDDYAQCNLCSGVVYYEERLRYSNSGIAYCSEHISETYMDDEEEEDALDYIDYLNK